MKWLTEKEKQMFTTNQKVTWASQAGGHLKVKQGEVIAVVEPGQLPTALGFKVGEGMARKMVSYVVKVGSKLYWPRVSALKPVTEETITPSI